ncbi:MAG: hypothetical protein IPL53_23935 [Ignavibacteria bacterium]|nr:hypothetical protein [Ignavibacteria bacterium]
MTKQNVYKHLYPGKKFKESVMNTILSGLNQICEEFILYQDFRNDPQRDMRLLRQYCKRGHKPKADKLSAKLEKLTSFPASSAMDFFERFEILESIDFYYSSYDKRKLRNQHLIKSLLNLDYYFILQTFVYKKELLSNTFYIENKVDDTLPLKIFKEINFDRLIGMIESADPENSILLSIYFLIGKTLSNNFDDVNYNKLRELVIVNLKKLDFLSGKNLLLNLQVISTMRLNTGRKEYAKEIYEISKLLIDGKFYDNDKNWFRPSHYRTIIKLGLSLGDIEYVEQFVNNYSKRLEPNLRIPLKHFAFANIFFEKQMYSEALNNLNKSELNNTLYKIDARRLTAKIYYETNSLENLQSLLDAFSHYLKNIRTTDQIIIARNKRFVKYLKELIKIKESKKDSFELSQLQNSMEKENVSDSNWLIQKLYDISNRFYSGKADTG